MQVINAQKNIGTISKYEGCVAGGEGSCYIIDGDWLPMHVGTMYRLFLEHGAKFL